MLAESVKPARDVDMKPMRLEKQLCFGLYGASHLITKAYRPYLKEMGLTYPQYLVLLALFEHDTQTVSALGNVLMLDSGTLSPLLKRLEAAGFIRKARHVNDERLVEVSLTAAGLDLQSGACAARMEVVRLLGMDNAKIADLRHELNMLMQSLDPEATGRMLANPA